ncbi:bifunctional phosphoribosylaminoimidazolecarboxamide formyltransferase/IMP cyclohydrolase [Halorussus gelatinilyticus]|uniref:Bifunctional phosphoribosylaminoimidazolecarboxamide formyltransferase/IMP cyclohydrolase n=1 Tax=Halorussus gelatinilyticus TaxID=2937524 RepID=A0A8U0IDZ7_9EURY|nr:bifunctional phosphoribosylaminoimidazolecarboxamide formyltransferase/IMP cyclohydrolase [Halorussus gelatinilyticus]UPV99286.1 bifunctional phosphoribosylaminoimidazolecarboxamide formyltransferase/IMP cyclohydrolase [Halorussus gelatinilyticus]
MTRIAGLASNRGRNLLHIADRTPGGAELGVVLTNDPDAPVLDDAEKRGIPTEVVAREEGESRRDHEQRVVAALADYDFELVCLDGYMRILSDAFLDEMPTTLNVHPSLLPSFPGTDAHEQVLDAGVKATGCTVHVVTDATDEEGNVVESEVDGGPIVTQEPVPVYEGDDESDLKERVLYEGEFKAYPRAVRWFAEGRLDVDAEVGAVRIEGDDDGRFPVRKLESADRVADLRYGENPHQDAALYGDATCEEASVVDAPQRNEGAKGMGYNNYNDADAALNLVKEFDRPAAAVIKHTNPAGCATADTLADAYEDALATDPKSAFGGIVALNRECDEATAEQVTDSFKEVVVAPGYTDDALDTLFEKDNLRVLDAGDEADFGEVTETTTEKDLVGGRLVQERDLQAPTREELEVVTEREPTEDQYESLLFAWQTIKHVKSNAILFADGTETVGVGAGQVSRVDAVEIAKMKAEKDAEGKSAAGAVMASDAFFPFPDAIEAAAEAGIEAVIQPGGSVNDDDVIEAADEHDMAMVFTGQRCFRHD